MDINDDADDPLFAANEAMLSRLAKLGSRPWELHALELRRLETAPLECDGSILGTETERVLSARYGMA